MATNKLIILLTLAFWAGTVVGAVLMGILMTRKLNRIMAAAQLGVKIPK